MGDPDASTASPLTFEARLRKGGIWVTLEEGDRYFAGRGEVHKTLRAFTARMDDLKFPYAVIGAVAMFAHGFKRFTRNVDMLISRDSWEAIQQELVGHGYTVVESPRARLRDAATGVRIDFVFTGDYPGDGLPKPVAFPDPAAVSERIGGVSYVNLPTLVELKLAAGLTKLVLIMHLGDAVALIKELRLPEDFGERLNPYVRAKYTELWTAIANDPVDEHAWPRDMGEPSRP